jgi:hypothetical protein
MDVAAETLVTDASAQTQDGPERPSAAAGGRYLFVNLGEIRKGRTAVSG